MSGRRYRDDPADRGAHGPEIQGRYVEGVARGIGFWGALYIPIVVAMASQQDVVVAVEGGPIVLIAGVGSLLLCFATVALISRLSGTAETMDEIEAREAREAAPSTTGPRAALPEAANQGLSE